MSRELPGGFELVVRWLLRTADAQSLYEKFGFRKPGERLPGRDRP